MERTVELAALPHRIISLVPSQTEFLIDIGAPVVGRTKFCIHPKDKVKNIPVIGGTKNFRLDDIRALRPDLIIGNKEENYENGIKELEKEFPVWMSDIYTLEDAFQMMTSIGQIIEREAKSNVIMAECKDALEKVKNTRSGKVIYFIWKDPWMVAGKNTFIDHMLSFLGYENLITQERYPNLSNEEISHLNPVQLLFSSEPFPFKQKHIDDAQIIWPNTQCEIVDGELFSWYGSRLKNWINQ